MGRLAVLVAAVAVLASSCTFVLRDRDIPVSCAPLHVALNPRGVAIDAARVRVVRDAFEEYGALAGRTIVWDGTTSLERSGRVAGNSVLIELTWPADAPHAWGYAESDVVDGAYTGGWVAMHPVVASMPTGVLRRLVLHEIGHLAGLDDVDDPGELMNPSLTVSTWGEGDLTGLWLGHRGGCG